MEPHQETNQFYRDFLLFFIPIYDANIKQGSISIYEALIKKDITNILRKIHWAHHVKKIYSKFEMKILNVKAGNAVLIR